MMIAWMDSYWFWFALAVAFLTLEVFVAGFVLIWFGIGALLTGMLELFFPGVTWYYSLLTFSLTSVASVISWKMYETKFPSTSDRPLLNQRQQTFLGRVVRLHEPIIGGRGRVLLDDSAWLATGPDLPAATWVRIIGLESGTFTVEPIDPPPYA